MEDWRDSLSVIGYSLGIAALVSTVICSAIYGILRFEPFWCNVWRGPAVKSDLRRVLIGGVILLALSFSACAFIGYEMSDLCGTGDVTEICHQTGNTRSLSIASNAVPQRISP